MTIQLTAEGVQEYIGNRVASIESMYVNRANAARARAELLRGDNGTRTETAEDFETSTYASRWFLVLRDTDWEMNVTQIGEFKKDKGLMARWMHKFNAATWMLSHPSKGVMLMTSKDGKRTIKVDEWSKRVGISIDWNTNPAKLAKYIARLISPHAGVIDGRDTKVVIHTEKQEFTPEPNTVYILLVDNDTDGQGVAHESARMLLSGIRGGLERLLTTKIFQVAMLLPQYMWKGILFITDRDLGGYHFVLPNSAGKKVLKATGEPILLFNIFKGGQTATMDEQTLHNLPGVFSSAAMNTWYRKQLNAYTKSMQDGTMLEQLSGWTESNDTLAIARLANAGVPIHKFAWLVTSSMRMYLEKTLVSGDYKRAWVIPARRFVICTSQTYYMMTGRVVKAGMVHVDMRWGIVVMETKDFYANHAANLGGADEDGDTVIGTKVISSTNNKWAKKGEIRLLMTRQPNGAGEFVCLPMMAQTNIYGKEFGGIKAVKVNLAKLPRQKTEFPSKGSVAEQFGQVAIEATNLSKAAMRTATPEPKGYSVTRAVATLKTIVEQDGLLGRAVNIAIVQNNLMIAQLMKFGYVKDSALSFDLSDLVDMLIQGVVPNPKAISTVLDAAWNRLYEYAIANKIGVSPYAVRRMPEAHQIKFPTNPNNPFVGYEDVHTQAMEFAAAREMKMRVKANGLKWMWKDLGGWSKIAADVYNAYAREIAKHIRSEGTSNDKATMTKAIGDAQEKFMEATSTGEERIALMMALFQHCYAKREENRAAPDSLLFQPSVIDGEHGFLDWFLQMWEHGKDMTDWPEAPVMIRTKNMWFSVFAIHTGKDNPRYADCPEGPTRDFYKEKVASIPWVGKPINIEVEHTAKGHRTWVVGSTGVRLSMVHAYTHPGEYTVIDARLSSDGDWVLFLQDVNVDTSYTVLDSDQDDYSVEDYDNAW